MANGIQIKNITAYLFERIQAMNLMQKKAVIYQRPDFDMELTYEELFRYSTLFASSLRQKGLAKGDRIFIRLTNSPEVLVAFLGAIQAGIIPAMMSTHVGNGDITTFLKETQAKILFSVLQEDVVLPEGCLHYPLTDELGTLSFGGFIENDQIVENITTSHNEAAFITYTSGITARPKAVLQAQHFLQGIELLSEKITGYASSNTITYIGDLCWSFGLYQGILLPIFNGSTMYMYYDHGGFKPAMWWQKIISNKVETVCTTPTVLRMMGLYAQGQKGELENCISVGENLSYETWKLWKEKFGISVIQSYGQAETGIIALDFPEENNTAGKTCGIFPGIKHGVIDEEGNQVQEGTPGHLVVAKDYPGVMLKYISSDEKNAEVFKGNWYFTGDIVMQTQGLLVYLGRRENILRTKGSKLSVVEIEAVYRMHEDVQEVAVVECPDMELGQVLKAFVKLKNDITQNDEISKKIQSFASEKLSHSEIPKLIEFISEMPKTKSGKTRREALRQMEMEKFLKAQAM
jgi:acyl-coenzyme A synthetase/AMP-(fatty) acid ligase